jgi:hypothetical protein
MTVLAPPRPTSSFLRGVRAALLADFVEVELVLAQKYAVLQASGYRRSEIVRMLDEAPAALKAAEQRVKNAVERLDLGDDG